MAKKFSELRGTLSPEAQARAAARTEGMLLEMQLRELRRSKGVTQVELAEAMGVEQTAVSKLERRSDMYLSTMYEYVKALGGELKLVASFPEGDIPVQPFEAGADRRHPSRT
ncbi:MAG: XRE family transcriptional regulator [Pleurocapsa sp. SU_196_0]|nr:XRE family transcriptional regulator [Pleurocapsa sp. SU_196_0]